MEGQPFTYQPGNSGQEDRGRWIWRAQCIGTRNPRGTRSAIETSNRVVVVVVVVSRCIQTFKHEKNQIRNPIRNPTTNSTYRRDHSFVGAFVTDGAGFAGGLMVQVLKGPAFTELLHVIAAGGAVKSWATGD